MFMNEEYRAFCEEVKTNMKNYLPEEYQDINISLYEATKNNGVKRIGLTFSREHEELSPKVYLEEFFVMAKECVSIGKICEEIVKVYGEAISKSLRYEVLKQGKYEDIKDHIFMTLVNYKRNEEMLRNVPHKVVDDLAVYYRICLPEAESYVATAAINKEMLEQWDISIEELHQVAYTNTPKILKPCLFAMADAISGMKVNLLETEISESEEKMYVLTSHNNKYGSYCVMYPEIIQDIRRITGWDFYILPSSIHETILIPKNEFVNLVYMGKMIREINNSQVDPEEQLSDHAYEVLFEGDEMKLVSVKESMKDWNE